MANTSKRRPAGAGKRRALATETPPAVEPAGPPAAGRPAETRAATPAGTEPGLARAAVGAEPGLAGATVGAEPGLPGAAADPASRTGWTLRWAVRVLLIEASATGLLTLVWIWAAIAAANASVSSAIATPAFFAICAAILAGLGTALNRGKALARGPAIVIEMLLIPMGYYMIVAGLIWLGVPTVILGLAGSALLLAPSTRTSLGLHR